MHFSDPKQILDKNNSEGSGDYRESPDEKTKSFSSKPLNFRKNSTFNYNFIKFAFSNIFRMGRGNFKKKNYKLDKILKNFLKLTNFRIRDSFRDI